MDKTNRYSLPRHHFMVQWSILGLAMLLIGLSIGYSLFKEYDSTGVRERDRLSTQARVINRTIVQHLEAVNRGLQLVREELPEWRAFGWQEVNHRLRALDDAMPGIRTIYITDPRGTVLAADRAELSGKNFSYREYFDVPRRQPDPKTLYISPPYKTSATGIFSMNVSLIIPGPHGEFNGIITATLDPSYFSNTLSSVLYAPDMWSSIVHGDGLQFLMIPQRENQSDINRTVPGSFFARHRKSGKPDNFLTGIYFATGEKLMMALSTVNPDHVTINKPLIVTVSRGIDSVYSGWRRAVRVQSALFGLMGISGVLGLYFYQRRQEFYYRRQEESIIALRDSELKYRRIVDTANEGIWMVGENTMTSFVNDRMADMLGYRPEEMIGKPVTAFMFEEDLPDHLRRMESRFQGESDTSERRFRRKDGQTVWTLAAATPILDDEHHFKGSFAMFTDITERRRAEEALTESERLLRESQISAGLGSYIFDIPNGLVKTSDILDKLFGIDEAYEHSLEGWAALIHPDDRKIIVEYLNEVISQGGTFDKEYRIIRHDNQTERWVHGLGKLELDVQGRPLTMYGTIQDITERKKLEEQLHQSQKLEAIGTLAGGIAHDFNNLLQGVFGYISIAKLNASNKDKSIAALEQAEKALHMSVNLTTQLLTFSKGGKPVKKMIHLQQVIDNSVRFALSGSRTDYRIKLDTELWHVDADEGQIGQVIQNLVLNADQAMPVGGTIVIAAKYVQASKREMPELTEEGRYVEISVEDEGIGISEEYLPKIFDPYFTTKAKGSGLGLATCYSIVRNHGGVIQVSSRIGKGTTFYIYLPAVETEKEVCQVPELSPFVRKAKILLMDDEELVRNIAGEMIEVLGHKVELAEHGEDAIGKYKAAMETGKPFDIVILDLTIRGGMGGTETIERLLAVDPNIRAIVSSGYSDDAVVSDYHEYGFRARLTKPYKLQELSNTLNNLLYR